MTAPEQQRPQQQRPPATAANNHASGPAEARPADGLSPRQRLHQALRGATALDVVDTSDWSTYLGRAQWGRGDRHVNRTAEPQTAEPQTAEPQTAEPHTPELAGTEPVQPAPNHIPEAAPEADLPWDEDPRAHREADSAPIDLTAVVRRELGQNAVKLALDTTEPQAASSLDRLLAAWQTAAEQFGTEMPGLTERQRQALQLALQGHSPS